MDSTSTAPTQGTLGCRIHPASPNPLPPWSLRTAPRTTRHRRPPRGTPSGPQRDGLLALLARGPSYGYQLKGDFEDATGGAWTLNIGQVYTSLQRLERDGLIEALPTQDGDDDRRSFTLTAAGREHLDGWLADPLPRTIEERDEVAMKILLAASAPGQDPHAVIVTQRASTMAALQAHTRQKARAQRPTLATAVHLDRLILACRSELDWLDLAEDRIADPSLVRPSELTATTTTDARTPLTTEGAPR